jgi:hypothetical protein
VVAQLRDVLATEDSAIVSEEDYYRGTLFPQRAETDLTAAGFRQHDVRESGAKRFCHGRYCIG